MYNGFVLKASHTCCPTFLPYLFLEVRVNIQVRSLPRSNLHRHLYQHEQGQQPQLGGKKHLGTRV